MLELDHLFIQNDHQAHLVQKLQTLAQTFALRADDYDRRAAFPFENFADLKKSNVLSLTVPQEYGGQGLSLYEFLLVQEMIARGDGPTALSMGWHLGIVMDLTERRPWKEDSFRRICEEVVEHQVLLNNAQSEAGTGSPTRGGRPQTIAEKMDGQWVINGRKTFTSLAPILDYFIVNATIVETDEVGHFLIPRKVPGLSIEDTWDTVGMRATRSDDLVLKNVHLPSDALVDVKSGPKKLALQGWLLHIPACYLGIAVAARNEAIRFASEYKPNSLSGSIKDVPEVRRKIGEIDLLLTSARHFMYSMAQKWDQRKEDRSKMVPELAAVKHTATNAAIQVVDLAMRIVGGQGLFSSSPMQRYYRDVRAGLHNPPADDITISLLADRALQ